MGELGTFGMVTQVVSKMWLGCLNRPVPHPYARGVERIGLIQRPDKSLPRVRRKWVAP